MSINDIYVFAKKNNCELTSNEANIIYKCVKKNWETLIFNDHNIVLNTIRNNINPTLYNKLDELIIIYKEKYKELI